MNNIKQLLSTLVFSFFAVMAPAMADSVNSTGSSPENSSTNFSGFLQQYKLLEPSKQDQNALEYTNPAGEIGGYQKIILDKVMFYAGEDLQVSEKNPELLEDVDTYFRQALVLELSKHYQILRTEAKGQDVMRINIAITGVLPKKSDTQIISNGNFGQLFFEEKYKTETASSYSVITAMEAEVRNRKTGTLIYEMLDNGKSVTINKSADEITLNELKPLLDYWAKNFTAHLVNAKNK